MAPPQSYRQATPLDARKIARQQAIDRGYDRLSLIAFEQNAGSARLQTRLGFEVIDRAPVVPHRQIHYTGDALLMIAHTDAMP